MTADAPYFFLSYAHTDGRELGGRGDSNTDETVVEFYYLLCQHIRQMTNIGSHTAPGYLDVLVQPGVHWYEQLLSQLAHCRVFVPLFSQRYFGSSFCGKEWDAFLRRERTHAGGTPGLSAIVPVIWSDMTDVTLPKCADQIQYHHSDLGALYKEHGIYGLTYAEPIEYQRAAYTIARTIRTVARATSLPPCKLELFDDLQNIFEEP